MSFNRLKGVILLDLFSLFDCVRISLVWMCLETVTKGFWGERKGSEQSMYLSFVCVCGVCVSECFFFLVLFGFLLCRLLFTLLPYTCISLHHPFDSLFVVSTEFLLFSGDCTGSFDRCFRGHNRHKLALELSRSRDLLGSAVTSLRLAGFLGEDNKLRLVLLEPLHVGLYA